MYEETSDVHSASLEYAKRFSGEVGAWMLEIQAKILRELVTRAAPKSILDVGGGHAQVVAALEKVGVPITVLGSSEDAWGSLKLSAHHNLSLASGNLLAIPFPDKSFDIVTCFRIVSHCEMWPRLLKELCRVSKRSVIIDYPTKRSVNAVADLFFGLKKKVEGNTRTYTTFNDADIEKAFLENNFSIQERSPQFFFPMALHRGMKKSGVSNIFEQTAKATGLTNLFGSPVILEAVRKQM